MIGRIAYRAARAGVRGAGAQPARTGPPKQWSPAGKVVFLVVLAAIITAMHWWLPVLCWGGALAAVTVPLALAGGRRVQRERQHQADALDELLASWED